MFWSRVAEFWLRRHAVAPAFSRNESASSPQTAQRFALARALRHRPTPAERHAWTLLRNRGILGLKFRRQHVLHGFIVDFYCASERVVIELEGSPHDEAA